MKKYWMIVLAAIGWLGIVGPAEARVFPGGGGDRPVAAAAVARAANPNYGNYGGWGDPAPQYNSGPIGMGPQRQDTGMYMLQQTQARDTLLTQGQARTNAIASQRQSYKDWWFQQEAQQSQRPQSALVGFEPADAPPPAAMDVIKWPLLLQDPAFASRRTQIEAPYRRSPPGLSRPTAEDYRNMVKTVGEMKDILEWLTRDGVDSQAYDQAKACLNNIEQEARQRAALGGTAPKPGI